MSKSQGILGAGVQIGFTAAPAGAGTTLSASASSSAGTISVTDATGYPTPPFLIVVGPSNNRELMLVTAVVGTTFTVNRGWGGTTGVAHASSEVLTAGYTRLAQIEDAKPPAKTRAKVSITNHDSPNRKEENIPGFLDVKETVYTFIYLKADAATVDGQIEDATIRAWIVTNPDGTYQTFTGYVSDEGIGVPLKDKMTRETTLTIDNGSVSWN